MLRRFTSLAVRCGNLGPRSFPFPLPPPRPQGTCLARVHQQPAHHGDLGARSLGSEASNPGDGGRGRDAEGSTEPHQPPTWFKDPLLLSQRAMEFIEVGRPTEAVELVKRHRDEANSAVFQELVVQLNLHRDHGLVLRTYHMVRGGGPLPLLRRMVLG